MRLVPSQNKGGGPLVPSEFFPAFVPHRVSFLAIPAIPFHVEDLGLLLELIGETLPVEPPVVGLVVDVLQNLQYFRLVLEDLRRVDVAVLALGLVLFEEPLVLDLGLFHPLQLFLLDGLFQVLLVVVASVLLHRGRRGKGKHRRVLVHQVHEGFRGLEQPGLESLVYAIKVLIGQGRIARAFVGVLGLRPDPFLGQHILDEL
mmetsp:Transcript_11904/g.25160  ORF Transcript_11904/g.25160 Transcript_11904/m.25160 type:complete len:202 (+) Transcript_11904:778-1383(+)